MRTRNMFDWWLKLAVESHALGRSARDSRGDHPGLSPTRYEVESRSRWRHRQLIVRFDPERAVAEASQQDIAVFETGADDADPDENLPLPDSLRTGVLDPLAAVIGALGHVRRHLAGGPGDRVLPVFDGRRRFDFSVALQGRAERQVGGTARSVYLARVVIRPVAGFKRRQLVFWEDAAFEVLLSRDDRFVPLQIVSLGAGPVLNLVEECPARCRIPPEDG